MRAVSDMVTEDQRDVAVSALEQIYRHTGKIVSAVGDDGSAMTGSEIAQMMTGILAVIRFTAHEAIDRVERMNEVRL